MVKKENQSRREFFKGAAIGGLVAAGGAIAGSYKSVDIESGRELRKLEKKYLQPGVFVGLNTAIVMCDSGKKFRYSIPTVNIKLLRDANSQVKNQFDYEKIDNSLGVKNGRSIYNLINCVAGPYTAVALVGSSAERVNKIAGSKDKFNSDLDVLVLNGGNVPYNSPREDGLFHNQRERIKAAFRDAFLHEIVDFYDLSSPKKAKDTRDHFKKIKEDPFASEKFYTLLPTTDEFLFPIDSAHYTKEVSPIHLLTAEDGKAENVEYNIEELKKARRGDRAVILYKGDKFKLI